MIKNEHFKFYNFCFDEEQIENLFKDFLIKKEEFSDGTKTFINLLFIKFQSDLETAYNEIEEKNRNRFFEKLLLEIDKTIKTCEGLLENNILKSDYKLFVSQIMRMSHWMIDYTKSEFRNQITYIKTYEANETKVKFEIPSQYSEIFRNQIAEQFFFETLTELDAKPNTYGFNAKISAVFSNKGFKNRIFKHELLQKKFVAFINGIHPNSIKNNSKLSNPKKYETKIEQIIKNYTPNNLE